MGYSEGTEPRGSGSPLSEDTMDRSLYHGDFVNLLNCAQKRFREAVLSSPEFDVEQTRGEGATCALYSQRLANLWDCYRI
jgi:hypothetical protein